MEIRKRSRLHRFSYFCCLMVLIAAIGCSRAVVLPADSQATIVTTTVATIDGMTAIVPTRNQTTLTGTHSYSLTENPTREQPTQNGITQTPSALSTLTPSAGETLIDETLHGPAFNQLPTRVIQPTPVLAPTLTNSEESELLFSLMDTNGGCDLPCWWGIEPGIMTEQEAWDLIQSYGLQWVPSEEDFRIILLGYPGLGNRPSSAGIDIRLWIQDGIVKYIGVVGGYLPGEFRAMFEKEWQAFSPAAIVGRFGRPELVEFSKVENSPYYQLVLAYDSLGIQMAYILPFSITNEGQREVCFVLDKIDYIYPALYQAYQSDTLPYRLLVSNLEAYVSWEEMTGQSLDDFMAIALDSGCVQFTP